MSIDKEGLTRGIQCIFLCPFQLAALCRSRKKLAISGWPFLAALVVKGVKVCEMRSNEMQQ